MVVRDGVNSVSGFGGGGGCKYDSGVNGDGGNGVDDDGYHVLL